MREQDQRRRARRSRERTRHRPTLRRGRPYARRGLSYRQSIDRLAAAATSHSAVEIQGHGCDRAQISRSMSSPVQ